MNTIDEQKLLREHYEIMADIKALKRDVEAGETDRENLLTKIEALERRAAQNDIEHLQYVKVAELAEIRDTVRALKGSTVIMSPDKAKENGNGFIQLILKNPTYLMWLILGAVVITMIIMGYSYAEISQVLERIK